MNAVSENRFYVYGLFDRGVPFYIGKGTRDRIKKHRKIAKDGSMYPIHCKIRKLNYEYESRILVDKLTDSDALELEELTIKTVGRRDLKTGTLLNLTDGGEGPAPSVETRKRQSIAQTGKKRSHEARINQAKALKGRTHTLKARRLLSESLMGHTVSSETRAKISATKQAETLTPERRRQLSVAGKMSKGRTHTDEAKAKITASKIGHRVSQATRDKISATLTGRVGKRQEIIKCPHCSKTGGKNCLLRWHFNNCLSKPGNENIKRPGMSLENREKHSKRMTGRKVKITQVTCPHCGKTGSDNAMRRWHFNNCKFKEGLK